MRFSITGVNHKTAPLEVRERLVYDERSIADALLELKRRPGFQEGLILLTCNRVEIALTCDDGPGQAWRWTNFWPIPAMSSANG